MDIKQQKYQQKLELNLKAIHISFELQFTNLKYLITMKVQLIQMHALQ
jgi:hypothetical protein